MKVLILFICWCVLLVLCWPVALLALLLIPLVWLAALVFKVIALCIEATFVFLRTLLFLPARILGYRGRC